MMDLEFLVLVGFLGSILSFVFAVDIFGVFCSGVMVFVFLLLWLNVDWRSKRWRGNDD